MTSLNDEEIRTTGSAETFDQGGGIAADADGDDADSDDSDSSDAGDDSDDSDSDDASVGPADLAS